MSNPFTSNPRARNQQGRSRRAQQLQLLELQVRNQILDKARAGRGHRDTGKKNPQAGKLP